MKGKLFPAAVVCLFLALAVQAQTKISVDEDRSSGRLNETAFDVSLVIGSDSGNFREQIALELLDEENNVRLRASQFHLIKKGENSHKISLPLADPAISGDDNLAWYRLRYRVGTASGIVSLSELIEDIFKLRVIATDNLFSGMIYRARIKAENPFTGKAVRDVRIGAGIELELKDRADEKLKLSAEAVTDREGFAVIDFQIPDNLLYVGARRRYALRF